MRNYVRISIGTAGVLGLAEVKMDTNPTTAYLMMGQRCRMSCAFCAQAQDSYASPLALSRITWPPFPREVVISALADAFLHGRIHRCCLQVTVTDDSFSQTLALVQEIKSTCQVPVDASLLPHDMHQIEDLVAAGLDHLGFGLDAACQRIFGQVKGGRWERIRGLMQATARRFPGRIAAHLIVGLGETEREMLQTIQELHALGITVGLFAFTPVPGTRLANRPAPPLDVYRRIQAARWLIIRDSTSVKDFSFTPDGRLEHLGRSDWRRLLSNGTAFRTSGCPDCNRPFYNERPSGMMYNYPRPLDSGEVAIALDECQFSSSCAREIHRRVEQE